MAQNRAGQAEAQRRARDQAALEAFYRHRAQPRNAPRTPQGAQRVDRYDPIGLIFDVANRVFGAQQATAQGQDIAREILTDPTFSERAVQRPMNEVTRALQGATRPRR